MTAQMAKAKPAGEKSVGHGLLMSMFASSSNRPGTATDAMFTTRPAICRNFDGTSTLRDDVESVMQ